VNVEPLHSPYKGLAAFDESDVDALLFFGRDHDTGIVVANALASRLTILYGPSGVGKSSLLRAGVVRELRELGRGQPVAVAVFASWSGDIEPGIEAAARQAIADALGADPGYAAGSLAERLDAWTAALGGELCLVLDQLEEAFLYRREGPLQRLLPELVTRPGLRVNVLLGIRDDALAQLDAFKAEIPGLFGNTLRLDHLDRASARRAILGPIDRWNELAAPAEPVEVEPELVEAVLAEVATDHDRVETTYLQLVLQRLWEVERARGSNKLELATLVSLGGAERIVETHLERALDRLPAAQQDAAAAMFEHLVTPSGSKIAHRAGDLATFAGQDGAEAQRVLDTLAQARILRPLRDEERAGGHERYEIYHDVLGEPIIAWRRRRETDRELAGERALSQRRHRRLVAVATGSLIAIALLSALTIYAFSQRHTARAEARAARSRELAAAALTQSSFDPELSLALAVKAAEVQPGPRVDEALREALRESRLRHIRAAARPVYAIGVDGDEIVAASHGTLQVLDPVLKDKRRLAVPGRLLAVRPGEALLLERQGLAVRSLRDGSLTERIALHPGAFVPRRDIESGVVVGRVRVPKPIRVVALGPHGGLVAVSDGSRRFVVMDASSGDARYELEQPSAVTAMAFGPGARTLATGGRDGDTGLWRVATGGVRAVLPGGRGAVRAIAFSPRATLIATANENGVARVWHTSNGILVAPLSGHTNPVVDIAFSPDGRSVATASTDGTARVWKAVTGQPLAILRASNDAVTSVRFSSDSGQVITAGDDRVVRLWNARAQPRLALVARFAHPVVRASWVARGIRAVTADAASHVVPVRGAAARPSEPGVANVRGNIVVIRGSNGRPIVLRGHTKPVMSVHFSFDGDSVVTASRDTTARIWSSQSGALRKVLPAHFGAVRDAEFSPDGRFVVTAGPGTGGLWDAGTGRLLFYLGGHTAPLTFASFNSTGDRIFTAGLDGTVRMYQCDICESGVPLLAAARRRLAETGRTLTDEERRRFLG
jgi:WD40 repeat protein